MVLGKSDSLSESETRPFHTITSTSSEVSGNELCDRSTRLGTWLGLLLVYNHIGMKVGDGLCENMMCDKRKVHTRIKTLISSATKGLAQPLAAT